jgi:uncharacterized protein YabN with tetrapyrrole methylase and pyrophosphatase domain
MQRRYDIYILGLGIFGINQVTKETEEALRICHKVYYLHTEPSVRDYLKSFNIEMENLRPVYKLGETRAPVYQAMANAVLEAAKEKPPVALAVYGHPTIFVSASRIIRERAPALGLSVQALPGISALDCLVIDLNFDFGMQGLVQYEATYALLYQPRLDPTVPCLLWQVGIVETRLFAPLPSRPERFNRLKHYLLQFYPENHKVALATSATNPQAEKEIIWVEIQDLPSAHQHFTVATTLFIPPASEPVVHDRELLQLLDDPEYVEKIMFTRP